MCSSGTFRTVANLLLLLVATTAQNSSHVVTLSLTPAAKGQHFSLITEDDSVVLRGHTSHDVAVTQTDSCIDFASSGINAHDVLEDCIELGDALWYGGPEQFKQYWPLNSVVLKDYSFVTKSEDNQGIAEPYWLSSKGVYIYVHQGVPLFVDMNNEINNTICLRSKSSAPYPTEVVPTLNYTICSFENARKAHEHAIQTVLGKPTGYPDELMIRHPIWSTWARYKKEVNESVVLAFAEEILVHGFNNSQLEIDDYWEVCYGALTFNKTKFPNPKNLTDTLKAKGFRVTLWVHPFVNVLCNPWHQIALSNGLLVHNATDNSTNTSWWDGEGGVLDFTNPDAVEWYVGRLSSLQVEQGIDAFKFDAGETSWMPQPPRINATPADIPGASTRKYVQMAAGFGPMIEVRVGQRTQDLPVFVRMLDKDSGWGWDNGLKTLVTTLLQMNMVGYPFVLPDMIGGNGYGNTPTKELFIRWLQANVFMPSLQYSYVPWDYDEETVEICRKYTDLHAQYADKMIELAAKATADGSPINPPIWWLDPTDETALAMESEFLLGEEILVAPVMEEGATSRDIYLPVGQWRDELRSQVITGPTWLRNYTVALSELAYFTLVTHHRPNTSL
ncbi:myogenesis-regulating glycosidase-like [Periplaneta americana]|uniref:myogenesis-regulating glycosidase-like n=1 Tax=Periplaneta americana TaxID=6978 RepID=UPI0037E9A788